MSLLHDPILGRVKSDYADEGEEQVPVRSRLAMVLLKGGLALGALWALALFAFSARAMLIFL